jgi:hypothetical protein
MSSISSLNSLPYIPQVSGQSSSSGVSSGQDADGDNDGSSGVRGSGRGQFASAIFQALSQAGINLPGTSGAAAGGNTTPGQDSNNSTQPGAGNPVQDALHAFMHSLFQALNQSGAAQNTNQSQSGGGDSDGDNDASKAGSTGAVHHRHHGGAQQFAADAQQLLQSLASGNTAGNSATSSLDASFQNLLQAVGNSSAGGSTPPTLQSFVQSLVNDLGGSAPQPSGNIVQSQA